IGNTNWGMQDGTMKNVSLAGWAQAFFNTNGNSFGIIWFNPVFLGNNIGMNLGSVNGQGIFGGVFAGESSAIQSAATAGGELNGYGITFVASGTSHLDFTRTITSAYIFSCSGCHFEGSATQAHAIQGF